ncbi:MAG: hypothetical protein V4694_05430 [Pseudomonadota bacterium]
MKRKRTSTVNNGQISENLDFLDNFDLEGMLYGNLSDDIPSDQLFAEGPTGKKSLNIDSLRKALSQQSGILSEGKIKSLTELVSSTTVGAINSAIKYATTSTRKYGKNFSKNLPGLISFINLIPEYENPKARDIIRSICSMIGGYSARIFQCNQDTVAVMEILKEYDILTSISGMQHRKGIISLGDYRNLEKLCTHKDGRVDTDMLSEIATMQHDEGMISGEFVETIISNYTENHVYNCKEFHEGLKSYLKKKSGVRNSKLEDFAKSLPVKATTGPNLDSLEMTRTFDEYLNLNGDEDEVPNPHNIKSTSSQQFKKPVSNVKKGPGYF